MYDAAPPYTLVVGDAALEPPRTASTTVSSNAATGAPTSPGTARPRSSQSQSGRSISFSMPSSPPRRQSRALSNSNNPPSSSIALRRLSDYGSTSEPDSPGFDSDSTERGGRRSWTRTTLWDIVMLPITVPLAIPRMLVSFSFRAFVFGVVCGVTVFRLGTAAVSSAIGGRNVRRR